MTSILLNIARFEYGETYMWEMRLDIPEGLRVAQINWVLDSPLHIRAQLVDAQAVPVSTISPVFIRRYPFVLMAGQNTEGEA